MKRLLFLLLLMVNILIYAQQDFFAWESETTYQGKIDSFQQVYKNNEGSMYIERDLLQQFITDYEVKKNEKIQKETARLLKLDLKLEQFHAFRNHFDAYQSNLTKKDLKRYLKKLLNLSIEEYQSKALYDQYFNLYWKRFGKDSFYKKQKDPVIEDSEINDFFEKYFSCPDINYKNRNYFTAFTSSIPPVELEKIKGTIDISGKENPAHVNMAFSFVDFQSGTFRFYISEKVKNLNIKADSGKIDFRRAGNFINVVLPSSQVKQVTVAYDLPDFIMDQTMCHSPIAGFFSSYAMNLPYMNSANKCPVDIRIITDVQQTVLLPGYNSVHRKRKGYRFKNENYAYQEFFLCYLNTPKLRVQNYKKMNNEIRGVCFANASQSMVRLTSAISVSVPLDSLTVVALPNVNQSYLYPGLAIIPERLMRSTMEPLFLTLFHAAVQSKVFAVRSEKKNRTFVDGFIENTSMRLIELIKAKYTENMRRDLLEIFKKKEAGIQGNPYLKGIYEGNFAYNYISKSAGKSLKLFELMQRFPGAGFDHIAENHFREGHNSRYAEVKNYYLKNARLPQFSFGDGYQTHFSNGRKDLRILVTQPDLVLSNEITIGITREDGHFSKSTFNMGKKSTLFIYPFSKAIDTLRLNCDARYLEYSTWKNQYECQVSSLPIKNKSADGDE